MDNSAKEQIKGLLLQKGYRDTPRNIELVFQEYMAGNGSINSIIDNLSNYLQKVW